MSPQNRPQQVERWGIFELSLDGPTEDNPFLDVKFSAHFSQGHRTIAVDGFYDGEGVYRVRFMPDVEGAWRYVTHSNRPELEGAAGEFTVVAPGPENHGPISVHSTYHFAYADGTPYHQIGTTCYVWNHQGDELEEQTLATLKTAPFNKMRMCVFPKHYLYNENEPPSYPFEGSRAEGWETTRFNPAYFRHLEQRVGDLQALGIEADLILFHPYDRWGFATMDAESDDRYLRYLVARLAAYRNIWWSMANEYDLMKNKEMSDWDRFFRVVQESDPYQHLRSIHNCRPFYDHNKPWVTHASVQHSDLERVREWRTTYQKPVVVDECCYEGNVERAWGNISAQEMVHRFWLGTVIGGGYVGHGETYLHQEDILWWAKGGVLHGKSPARIAFLRRILEDSPPQGLEPVDRFGTAKGTDFYLYYFGVRQPGEYTLKLPSDRHYTVEIIDTWHMTLTPLGETVSGEALVKLPSKPYLGLRVRAI
ncbi:MAG: DUF5060 domain-containing protein [Caldilineaceae bacterium]|nr:DUF5060 domain-containing protein [Caldilineaceae bacterium]